MSADIEEFEDQEGVFIVHNLEEEIGVEVADDDEIEFLDGLVELSFLQSELSEVRGNLAQARSNGQYVPLKLYRSHCHNSLSVSDIQSGMWCERQLEYRYLYPHMKGTKQWLKEKKKGREVEKKTKVMVKGSKIHEKKELEVHDRVVVPTITREDRWAVQLLNTYNQLSIVKEGKLEREISIFGELFNAGILINGVVDQLQYSLETQELILTDLKTRHVNSLPGKAQVMGHRLQLMVYKLLLDGLTRGSTKMDVLTNHVNLNFGTKLSMSVIDHICTLGLQSVFSTDDVILNVSFGDLVHTASKLIRGLDLPPVTALMVYYEYQETNELIGNESIEFDEAWARETLNSAVGFWRGEREPSGPEIEDLWKCDACQFKNVCVWRKQKALEASPGTRILDSPVKSPAVRILSSPVKKDLKKHL